MNITTKYNYNIHFACFNKLFIHNISVFQIYSGLAVVVSAMGKHPIYETKTTDLLLNLLPDAIASKDVRGMLDLILTRHIETMKEMVHFYVDDKYYLYIIENSLYLF